MASRMESSGAVGRINISEATYELVDAFFACEARGKIQAKNKGEVAMYFVDGILPELSVQGAGQIPNDAFRARLDELRREAAAKMESELDSGAAASDTPADA